MQRFITDRFDRWSDKDAALVAKIRAAEKVMMHAYDEERATAYAAATEYLQHGDGAPSEAKAASLMFGAGADRTRKAMTEALELSGAAT